MPCWDYLHGLLRVIVLYGLNCKMSVLPSLRNLNLWDGVPDIRDEIALMGGNEWG